MMGPIQEKETRANVKAIKKIPVKLLVLAFESAFVCHDAGNWISKAPRNEIPKIKKIKKKIILAIQLVANLFKAAGPKIKVIKNPSTVKMMMIESE